MQQIWVKRPALLTKGGGNRGRWARHRLLRGRKVDGETIAKWTGGRSGCEQNVPQQRARGTLMRAAGRLLSAAAAAAANAVPRRLLPPCKGAKAADPRNGEMRKGCQGAPFEML